MENEMRLGNNKLDIVGMVKEQKLEEVINDKKEKTIRGSLVIKAGEFKEVELHVYVGEKNKKGDVKKGFTTLKGFLEGTYKTMANANDEEPATKVKIYGNGDFTPNMSENLYKSKQTGEVKSTLRMNLGFGSIVIDNSLTEEDYKAEFDIEIFVKSMIDEVDASTNEETGRLIVEGYLPVYGGTVVPVKLYAGKVMDEDEEIDIAEGVRDMIQEGDTFAVWGDIDFEKKIIKTKRGGGIGKAKEDTKNEYINELVITGGDLVEDELKIFDEEQIRVALLERDKKIEEVKSKEDNKEEDKKSKGIGGSRPKRERAKF